MQRKTTFCNHIMVNHMINYENLTYVGLQLSPVTFVKFSFKENHHCCAKIAGVEEATESWGSDS